MKRLALPVALLLPALALISAGRLLASAPAGAELRSLRIQTKNGETVTVVPKGVPLRIPGKERE